MTAQKAADGQTSDHEVAPGLSAFRMTRAELAAVGRPGNWLSHRHPTLSLHIMNTTLCMKIKVVLSEEVPGARRPRQTVLCEAEFQPSEVTPRKLVEWGYRALADILAKGTGLYEPPQG